MYTLNTMYISDGIECEWLVSDKYNPKSKVCICMHSLHMLNVNWRL